MAYSSCARKEIEPAAHHRLITVRASDQLSRGLLTCSTNEKMQEVFLRLIIRGEFLCIISATKRHYTRRDTLGNHICIFFYPLPGRGLVVTCVRDGL